MTRLSPIDPCRSASHPVIAQLLDELGSFAGVTVEIHAGAIYREFGLTGDLENGGAIVQVPAAAGIVGDRYGADAPTIWAGNPTAGNLRARFDEFRGIGQKKVAMAVEILERDMRVPLTDLTSTNIAYDVEVRRVFLRSTRLTAL